MHDPEPVICHVCVKGKCGTFQFSPSQVFQRDCYGFGDRLHARLLACHETRRHKDTRRSHANRILTLPDKMRLFFSSFLFFFFSFSPLRLFQASFTVASQSCMRRSYCSCVHPGQIEINMIRMKINWLVSPAGLRASLHYSLSL